MSRIPLRERLAEPPPGPSRPGFWRSPLRGPWLTAFFGSVLLVGLLLVSLTGFLSHAAYRPALGRNAIVPLDRDLPITLPWPSGGPDWLYALNQGVHVTLGVVLVPLILAKLWSVIPRLFAWPPVSSPAQALERLSLLLLVGGAGFQFATGIVNAQIYYPFSFNFVLAHYYGAVVFTGAFLLHAAIQMPKVRRAARERGVLKPLLDAEASRRPEERSPEEAHDLVAPDPAPATISRRGLVGMVGGAMGLVFLTWGGQSIGGPLRKVAVLAPRGRGMDRYAQGFVVNKTAASARVTRETTGAGYRLVVAGPGGRSVELSREELLAMPQTTTSCAISCVEGWSTRQRWTGVLLTDLAARVGAADGMALTALSLQPAGVLRQASFSAGDVHATNAMLALAVNGEPLALDHGYPARIMVPGLPGVHQTKWVGRLTFFREA